MKPEIHPEYKDVVFQDTSVDPPFSVLTRSTMSSSETIEWEDGNTYPLIRVEVSSASHPFFTGKQRLVDTAGMVERYRRRYGQTKKAPAAEAEQPAAPAPAPQADAPAAQPAPQAPSADATPAEGTPSESAASDS